MTKWLEFQYGPIIDRYKIIGMTEEEFFDKVCTDQFVGHFKDITETEYELFKSHETIHCYNKHYILEKYRYQHASKEDRNEYNRTIRTIKRNKLFESFLDTGEL